MNTATTTYLSAIEHLFAQSDETCQLQHFIKVGCEYIFVKNL